MGGSGADYFVEYGLIGKIGSTAVTILGKDKSGMITKAQGATVPTDASAGAAVGCIFFDTDSGAGTTIYINEGSTTSCDFNALTSGSSATAYDDIGNPDASGSISFAGYTGNYTS